MAIMETLRTLGETVKTVHDAELKISLQTLIIELQNQVLSLQEQVREKQTLIDEFERGQQAASSKGELLDSLVFDRNSYWRKDKPGDGPFCPNCAQSKGETHRLTSLGPLSEYGICPVCDKQFNNVFPVHESGIAYGQIESRTRGMRDL